MVNPKSEETHEHKKINKIKEEKKTTLFIYLLSEIICFGIRK